MQSPLFMGTVHKHDGRVRSLTCAVHKHDGRVGSLTCYYRFINKTIIIATICYLLSGFSLYNSNNSLKPPLPQRSKTNLYSV